MSATKQADHWTENFATDAAQPVADSQPEAHKPDSGHPDNGAGHSDSEAQPFPLHSFGVTLSAIADAVCEVERVPESLAGCCALGILSASIGAGLQVQSGANRVTRGNLYILASAQSGSGKSETFRHLAKPFLQFDAERLKSWEAETLPDLLAEKKVLECEIKKLEKSAGNTDGAQKRDGIRSQLKQKLAALKIAEAELFAPALSCEDVTTERLAVLLAHNAEQIASLSADAGCIVNILLGRYSKLDRTDEGLYLKAFSGDVCRIDRQSREPVLLQSPCLTALWLTQPDKLESLLAERSLSDGGLIPRILACHTNCEARDIIEDAAGIPAGVSTGYADLIRSLLETYRLASEPRTIHPAADALRALIAHHNAIVARRRWELRDVPSFAARWNEQAWRIAVCLHAEKHGATAHDHRLELETAARAIEIADWFAAQQLGILNTGRTQQKVARVDKLRALIVQQYGGTATLRDLRKNNGFEPDEVRELSSAFPHLLAIERHETGGRPSETVSLPKS